MPRVRAKVYAREEERPLKLNGGLWFRRSEMLSLGWDRHLSEIEIWTTNHLK